MEPYEDNTWDSNITYLTRAFGAWYVAYHALHNVIDPGFPASERPRYEHLFTDACWALGNLTPPPSYVPLHQNLQIAFDRARTLLTGHPAAELVDLIEDLQIAGVMLKQELHLVTHESETND